MVSCISVNPIVHGALWSRLATNFFRVSRRGRVCHRVCYRACHMAQHEAAVSNCSFSAQKVLAPRGYQPALSQLNNNTTIIFGLCLCSRMTAFMKMVGLQIATPMWFSNRCEILEMIMPVENNSNVFCSYHHRSTNWINSTICWAIVDIVHIVVV